MKEHKLNNRIEMLLLEASVYAMNDQEFSKLVEEAIKARNTVTQYQKALELPKSTIIKYNYDEPDSLHEEKQEEPKIENKDIQVKEPIKTVYFENQQGMMKKPISNSTWSFSEGRRMLKLSQ